jgi:hypothetical protein
LRTSIFDARRIELAVVHFELERRQIIGVRERRHA